MKISVHDWNSRADTLYPAIHDTNIPDASGDILSIYYEYYIKIYLDVFMFIKFFFFGGGG